MGSARQAHQTVEGEDRAVKGGVRVGEGGGVLLFDKFLPRLVVVGQDRAGEADHDRGEVRRDDFAVTGS